MSRKSKGRHTATSLRGRDEARELADDEAAAPTSIWTRVREFYPPQVCTFVDAVVEQGGLSLSDIETLECAEHERILGIFAQLQKRDATALAKNENARLHYTASTHLLGLRLQSRKHLRTLRLCMSPISSPNHSHPPLTAAMLARIEGEIIDDDSDDPGDDLLGN